MQYPSHHFLYSTSELDSMGRIGAMYKGGNTSFNVFKIKSTKVKVGLQIFELGH